MRHPPHHDPTHEHDHYNPNQPRVPAGQPDGGQWTGGESHDQDKIRLALSGDPRRFIWPMIQKRLEAGLLALYEQYSRYNNDNQRTVLEVEARGFFRKGAPAGEFDKNGLKILTQQQVNNTCGQLARVQELTDKAVAAVKTSGEPMSLTQFGTAVHQYVAQAIKGRNNPSLPTYDENFRTLRAEISYVKMEEEGVNMKKELERMQKEGTRYGTTGSIRVDVLEHKNDSTVCVYDIKTGDSGLSPARFAEIFANVRSVFPDATNIIITEVRPSDPWRPSLRK